MKDYLLTLLILVVTFFPVLWVILRYPRKKP